MEEQPLNCFGSEDNCHQFPFALRKTSPSYGWSLSPENPYSQVSSMSLVDKLKQAIANERDLLTTWGMQYLPHRGSRTTVANGHSPSTSLHFILHLTPCGWPLAHLFTFHFTPYSIGTFTFGGLNFITFHDLLFFIFEILLDLVVVRGKSVFK